MVNTHSAAHNQPSRLTPSVTARRRRNSPQQIQNPPFCHRYGNLPERPSDTPHPSTIRASQGNSGNSVDPDSSPPNDDGDNDSHNLNSGSVHMPVPEPESKPKPKDTGKVFAKTLT